ncbi:MAG TPA: hypothetical protein VF801_15075 [Rhodocyclaceae bacterium]
MCNINNRTEVERFLRDANADQLIAEREHLKTLMASAAPSAPAALLSDFAARIAYELRFRIPQPI